MKLGSFIVGSLVGMAGAIYLSNRSPSTVRAMTSILSDVKNSKMMNSMSHSTKDKKSFNAVQKNKKNEQDQAGVNRTESKQLIQEIIESDPKLKQEFNEIKNEASGVQH